MSLAVGRGAEVGSATGVEAAAVKPKTFVGGVVADRLLEHTSQHQLHALDMG